MSPRTFVARGAALLALASLGLAACESKTVIPPTPPPPLTIQVTPSSLSFTAAGQKAQVVASLTGGETGQAAQGVTWSSTTPAVATVDQSGVVTAVASGTTSIIATSKALASVIGAASVVVNIPTTPPVTPPAKPTVSISSITDNAGNNVNVSAVQGPINVTLNVDVPTGNAIKSVNWLIDGKTVCSQTFTSTTAAGLSVEAANAVTMTCQINTTAVGANGAPTFANGAHTISATLVDATGTTQASTSQSLVFANVDVVNATVTATKGPQTSNLGISWVGGDLTVTATPAIFSGSNVARMTVTLSAFNQGVTATRTDTLASDGLSVTFPNSSSVSNNVAGWQDSVKISINTVTVSGQQGPTFNNFTTAGNATGTVTRIDNVAPKVTRFKLPTNSFINGSFAFGSTSSSGNFTGTDSVCVAGPTCISGVDRVTAVFSAAPLADTSNWKVVTTGADLAEVATPSYIVKVLVTDALGNSKTYYANNTAASYTLANATTFAVDLVAPTQSIDSSATTMTATGTANSFRSQSTSGNTVRVVFSDTGAAPSGPKGIRYKIIQYTSSATTCLTFDADNGCSFGTGTGAGFVRNATTTTSDIPVPAGAAYDSIYVQTVDFAGNVSSTIAMLVLQDDVNPALGGIVGPSVITGGSSVTFSTQASDNVDLRSASANEVFGASVLTIFAGSSTVGTFGLPLETSASPSVTLNPFITSIEQASAMGSSQNASAINFSVTDQSRRSATQSLNIAANVSDQSAFTFSTAIASGGAGVTSASLASSKATVCNQSDPTDTGKVCGTVPTATTLTYTVNGPTGTFANPFAKVNFYYTNGTVYSLIGSASGASASDNGTTRTWSFNTTWTPAGFTAGAYTVIAIGIDSKGHGLVAGTGVNVADAAQ